MVNAAYFTVDDARRLVATVARLQSRLAAVERSQDDGPGIIWGRPGVLTSELAPGGSATFDICRPLTDGGMGSAIIEDAKLVDVGLMEADDENFPVGTPVVVIWGGYVEPASESDPPEAVWIVIAARCPA